MPFAKPLCCIRFLTAMANTVRRYGLYNFKDTRRSFSWFSAPTFAKLQKPPRPGRLLLLVVSILRIFCGLLGRCRAWRWIRLHIKHDGISFLQSRVHLQNALDQTLRVVLRPFQDAIVNRALRHCFFCRLVHIVHIVDRNGVKYILFISFPFSVRALLCCTNLLPCAPITHLAFFAQAYRIYIIHYNFIVVLYI